MSGVPRGDAYGGLPGAPARKRAIERYVEDRIGATDLDIAHIVRRFGLSRPTLQRLFRGEGGFASYVRERRLRCAFGVLASQEDAGRPRVSDVAYAHGFSDTSAFSRAFRRRFGVTACDVAARAADVSGAAQAGALAAHLSSDPGRQLG